MSLLSRPASFLLVFDLKVSHSIMLDLNWQMPIATGQCFTFKSYPLLFKLSWREFGSASNPFRMNSERHPSGLIRLRGLDAAQACPNCILPVTCSSLLTRKQLYFQTAAGNEASVFLDQNMHVDVVCFVYIFKCHICLLSFKNTLTGSQGYMKCTPCVLPPLIKHTQVRLSSSHSQWGLLA